MPVVHDMQLGFDWGSKQAWRCPASQSMAEAERASLTQLSVRGKHVEATWGDGTRDVIADVSLVDFATMQAGDNVRMPVGPLEDCFAFKRGQLRVRLMERSSCVRVFLTRLKQPLDNDMLGPPGIYRNPVTYRAAGSKCCRSWLPNSVPTTLRRNARWRSGELPRVCSARVQSP